MKREFSYIKILVYRLLTVLFLFEICRLLFLIFNYKFFANEGHVEILSTFWYGLLFDTSVILYINVLYIVFWIVPFRFREFNVFRRLMKYLFIITNSAGILLNVIDFEFFNFTNKRSGVELFEIRNDVGNLFGRYLIDYFYLIIIGIVLITLLVVFYERVCRKEKPSYTIKSYLVQFLLMIITIGLFIIGGRGGFYLKPIRPFDATRFVKPSLMPLVLNTPFTMMFTAENYSIQNPAYMSYDEAVKLWNPCHYPLKEKAFKKENIVIIILESFGKEYVGYFNHGKGYTPFLDSLCQNGLVFSDAYADGKSTNTGVPAVITGMPSWMDVPYLNSNYQGNRINSIGELLRGKGYYTAFFHGARNGSIALDNLVAVSEFGDYYGMNEYNNKADFDGDWGIYDEPFMQFAIKVINKKPEPFCMAVFTVSSHHPYKIPEKYKGKFREGTHPIHKSVQYTDYALGKFFETASKSIWFKNTVFIITADHSAANQQPFYQTLPGRYAIPLVFFKADGSLKGNISGAVQQIDIMPGIMGYLNYDHPFFSFGKNIMSDTIDHEAIQYDNGIWQYIKLPYILHFNGKKAVGFYNYKKDRFLTKNLVNTDIPEKNMMEKKLKAVIQVYSESLINNKTFINPGK